MRTTLSALLLFGTLTLTIASTDAAFAKTLVSLATDEEGGTYRSIGAGLAEVISRHLPDVQMVSEEGNSSVTNLNLIGTHEIEMAFAQNDAAYWAYHGQRMFKTPYKNIRLIASLYPEHIQCITLKGSGVKNITDIRGKRLSTGAPGSETQGDVSAILQIAGIKHSDIKAVLSDVNDIAIAQQFRAGQLDVGFITAGYPTPSIVDLAATCQMDLVPFSDTFMDKLIGTFRYFVKSAIPAGTYNGVDHDTPTPAVMVIWICDADLPDDLVYRITEVFWANVEEMHKVHPKCTSLKPENALMGAPVPLHPGAARYYKAMNVVR